MSGFNTDFTGAFSYLSEGDPMYGATVGATTRFQRAYDNLQPGDPAPAAAVLLQVAATEEPLLRPLLGSGATCVVEANGAGKALRTGPGALWGVDQFDESA